MSSDLNKWIGIGRLTKDPELKTTQSGTSICSFSIASNDSYKSNGEKVENVSFFNCIAFSKGGEIIAQYMKKGNQIAIEGKLKQNKWQDKDGNNRYSIEIIISSFQFIGGKSDNSGLGQTVTDQPSFEELPPMPEENPFSDDSIPF